MARPLRIEFDGAWYHVMNRGAGKRRVFRRAIHYEMFLELLEEISEVFCVEIHAYCLMGNHYHLLIRTPQAGLARPMRHLDGVYTQRFNRNTRTDGPLFRGRYRSLLVDADAYLTHVSRYIHLNPVDSEMVIHPGQYRYSSYRGYLDPSQGRAWLHTTAVLTALHGKGSRRAYQKFVEAGIDKRTRDFYNKKRLSPVFGEEQFKRAIESRSSVHAVDPEVPDGKRIRDRPALEEIDRAVRIAFGSSSRQIAPSRTGASTGNVRGAFVYLARREAGFGLREIAAWLGYSSYAGPAKALARFTSSMDRSDALRRGLADARRVLSQVKT